jgi:hypothetical protein
VLIIITNFYITIMTIFSSKLYTGSFNNSFICRNISFIVILKSSKLGLVTIRLVSSAYRKMSASVDVILVNHLRMQAKITDQELSLAKPHV